MINLALKAVQTFPIGEMSLRCETQSSDQVFTMCCATILSLDSPFHGLVVKLSINHAAIKRNILPDIKLLVNVIEVLSELFPAWVLLGPIPILANIVSIG